MTPAPYPRVSIPFKREGLSEPNFAAPMGISVDRFNSLQTGRSFRTTSEEVSITSYRCFNSLQTGRSFRTIVQSLVGLVILCFNSLQTGRSFRT